MAILDRIAAAAALMLLAPVMLVCAVAVLIDDGPPVLYRQICIGRHWRSFQILKFRSMRTQANGPGSAVTVAGDLRVTRAGRILRPYKLDELPQLWNVLRGEMALVGPRPEVPEYVDKSNPAWIQIVESQPGITDLATLLYRNEEILLRQVEDPEAHYRTVVLPTKLALNLHYVRTRSALRDLKLIWFSVHYS